MTLFMETTKIPVGQTVAEIQRILGEYGCCAVMTEYEKGEVKAVCFKAMFLDKTMPFKLPCRWEPIYKIFLCRRKNTVSNKDSDSYKEQAKRVAWRQILRWVEAQMALVETGMVKVQEIFLPYMQVNSGGGKTLYEEIENNGLRLLEAPK